MGLISTYTARRMRTGVRLNLPELNAVLDASAGTSRRPNRDLESARARLIKGRNRRQRAVARAR